MPRVIVSAGHTSQDPGSTANGLREVDLTKIIARKVVPYLRSNGIITLSVPPGMDLARRIEWINSTGYSTDFKDISLEIHINDGGKSGFEFWYKGEGGDESKNLANDIMDSVTAGTGLENQGVKSEFDHDYGSLAFISNTNTISVLLECLYIDNPEDSKKLKNDIELDKIAKNIAKGILKFLNIPFKEPQVATPKPQKQKTPAFPQRPTTKNNTTIKKTTNTQRPVPVAQKPATPPPPQMSREDRKKMITKTYKKLLGREPNANDLNYFLNIGITEEKLILRIIDSQEHLDLVKTKTNFEKMKVEYQKQNMELVRLRAENADNRAKLQNLSQLIHQKNRYLSEMRYRTSQNPNINKQAQSNAPKKKVSKGSATDRFFHFFSGILG